MAPPDPDPPALALLDRRRRDALAELAATRHRPVADLLNDAIDAYLDADQWQRAEIEAAVLEAEADDFADPNEVAAAFRPR